VEDQSWQQSGGENPDGFEFGSGAEATYRVKIEGRLLDDDQDDTSTSDEADADKMDEDGPSGATQTKAASGPKQGPYRFSHFFKSMAVDFPASKVDQSVEWKKPDRTQPSSNLPAAADFDELTFKRGGDENMNITINLYRHEDPERFLLSPELAAVVDMEEATRQEVLMGIWEYVKVFGLQEDEEKRNFRCDELLKKVSPRAHDGLRTNVHVTER
jgi:SWI/SNF-related matrix-associated actin-dependent regulator of chromatin subfamily D